MITYELYAWTNEKRGYDAPSDLVIETTSIAELKKTIKQSKAMGLHLKDIMTYEADWRYPEDTHAYYVGTLDIDLKDKGY